jgi:hypothetical protein
LIESSIEQSMRVAPQLLAGDFGTAMLKLHTRARRSEDGPDAP